MQNPDPNEPPVRSRVTTISVLALIMALGLGLRLYRLGAQSSWLDEFNTTVAYLDSPDLGTYWDLIRVLVPEQVPVYYVLQYFWVCLVGPSLWTWRLMPVALGVLCIPLIYACGSLLYGRRAGWVAAVCLALSPIQIFRAQDLLAYAFVMPLTLLSFYSVLRALRDRTTRWWIVNCVVNMLLVWTHRTTIVLVFLEIGVLLMLVCPRERRAAPWLFLQLLLLLPWFYQARGVESAIYSDVMPSLRGIVRNVVGGDIVVTCNHAPDWRYLPAEELPWYLAIHPWLDRALMGMVGCALLWLGWRVLRSAGRLRRHRLDARARPRFDAEALLLVVAVAPICVLAALTLFMERPLFLGRYCIYTYPAIYLILGGFAGQVRVKPLHAALPLAVAVLYAYQAAIFVPFVFRTDWQSAADYVRRNASPDDLIVVGPHYIKAFPFHFAIGPVATPMVSGNTDRAFLEIANGFLAQDANPARAAHTPRSVWVLHNQGYLSRPLTNLETGLATCGLSFSRKQFLGDENLLLYRVTRNPSPPASTVAVSAMFEVDDQCTPGLEGLRELELPALSPAEQAAAALALRKAFQCWPPGFFAECAMGVFDQLQGGSLPLAAALAHRAVTLNPRFALAQLALGLVRARLGDDVGAMRAFESTFGYASALDALLRPLVTALCKTKDFEAVEREMQRLESVGFPLRCALRETCRRIRHPSSRPLPFSAYPLEASCYDKVACAFDPPEWKRLTNPYALVLQGELMELQGALDEAAEAYRKAFDLDPEGFYLAYRLDCAFRARHEPDAVIGQWRDLAERYPRSAPASYWLAVNLDVNGKDTEAAAAYQQAAERGPRGATFLARVVEILERRDQARSALGALHDALAANPNDATARTLLLDLANTVCLRRDADDPLLSPCRAALELLPHDTQMLNLIAQAAQLQHDAAAAAAAFREIIEAEPDNAFALVGEGSALQDQGDLPAAIARFQKAIALRPNDPGAHFLLGVALAAQGEHTAALDAIRTVRRLEPNNVDALTGEANILQTQGNLPESIALYRKAAALQPDAPAYRNLARALQKQGDTTGAAEAIRKAIALDPRNPQTFAEQAQVLEAQGDLEGALDSYRHMLDADPQNLSALMSVARLLDQQGDLEAAADTLRNVLTSHPDAFDVHRNLGAILEKKKDYDGALAAYRAARSLQPEDVPTLLGEGRILEARKDWDGATAAYRKAAGLRPDDAEIHNRIATVLARQDKFEDALEAFRKARTIDPRNAAAAQGEASVLESQGDIDGAIPAYRQAIELRPDDPEAHLRLGMLLKKRGDRQGALEALRAALAHDPQNPHALASEADILETLGDTKTAVEQCRKAIEIRPDDPDLYCRLGALLEKRADNAGALEAFRKALARNPEHVRALQGEGQALAAEGDFPAGVASLRKAIALRADDPDLWFTLGGVLRKQGSADAAREAFQKAIALDPKHFWARMHLGQLRVGLGDLKGAAQMFREATELRPDDPGCWLYFAEVQRRQGEFAAAIEAFRKALTLAPKNLLALNALGQILEAQGDLDQAIECSRKAVAIEPANGLAKVRLAALLEKRGHIEESLDTFRQAIEAEPRNVEALEQAGALLESHPDLPRALPFCKRVSELLPENPYVHYLTGRVHEHQGDPTAAAAAYRQALTQDPQYQAAKTALDRIGQSPVQPGANP